MEERSCLLYDAGYGLAPFLVHALAERNCPVMVVGTAATPVDPYRMSYLSEAQAQQAIARHEVNTIILNHSPLDEFALLRTDASGEALATAVDQAVSTFLRRMRHALLLAGRQQHTAVWILGIEDSFGYYLDSVPLSPIVTQACNTAMRSLAREYSRMGVHFNSIMLQPVHEMVAPGEVRQARNTLKTYALKFRFRTGPEVAAYVATLITAPTQPVAGSVISVGIGVHDLNI
jgi:hypothetical protein